MTLGIEYKGADPSIKILDQALAPKLLMPLKVLHRSTTTMQRAPFRSSGLHVAERLVSTN